MRIESSQEARMAIAQRMSEETYQQFVLSQPDRRWELHDGRLVEKPGVTWEHANIAFELGHLLRRQLDRAEYRVLIERRVRRQAATIFLPDLMVVPTEYGDEFRGLPGTLAIFSDPLPLVVEVWSRSTGDYDVDAKLPIYQHRGDLEIWRIHPYERTVTAWQRQEGGSYRETIYREGIVSPVALPGVEIGLDELFDN
jgi:Uma2 family endonuclease